jgi:hypothetical protein
MAIVACQHREHAPARVTGTVVPLVNGMLVPLVFDRLIADLIIFFMRR